LNKSEDNKISKIKPISGLDAGLGPKSFVVKQKFESKKFSKSNVHESKPENEQKVKSKSQR